MVHLSSFEYFNNSGLKSNVSTGLFLVLKKKATVFLRDRGSIEGRIICSVVDTRQVSLKVPGINFELGFEG